MNQKGFTIVELLIVVVVVGILAGVTIVAYSGISQSAREASLESDLNNAAKRLKLDQVDLGAYPATTLLANNGDGLQSSPDTTYQYTVNNSTDPQTFCLTATIGSTSFFINNDGTSTSGACAGHSSGGGPICSSGFIVVPGNSTFSTSDFCVAKYEMKIAGQSNGNQTYSSAFVPESRADGTPWANISQTNSIAEASTVSGCTGCHLVSEAEWMTIAANVLSVSSNWSSGTVGTGYIFSGHNDTTNIPVNIVQAATTNDSDGYYGTGNSTGSNQRRTLTLTNGEVIWDLSGNIQEWTTGTIAAGQQPGLSGEVAYAWKEWNNPSLIMNGLLATSRPSAISGTVAGYSSIQGVGQIYSNPAFAGTRSFIRGGGVSYGVNAGILSLGLSNSSGAANASTGFRVAM